MEPLKEQIHKASREELVLMLYDGAIRLADQAKDRINTKDLDSVHAPLIRAQNIVLELLYALDRKAGGAVADNLAGLYTYCYQRLVEANLRRDPTKIDAANSVLRNLRDAWAIAVKALHAEVPETNCKSCRHRDHKPPDGHCYMFREFHGKPKCGQFKAREGGLP